jgi:exodeoxyribonuclease V alpha subunit
MLPDKINPVLSKELIYTGITRGRTTVAIAADQAVFTATVNQKVSRDSGLAGKLIASSTE